MTTINVTMWKGGAPSGGVAWGSIAGNLQDQTDLNNEISGLGGLSVSSTVLTAEQIRDLGSSPQLLVPAQGANKVIVPMWVEIDCSSLTGTWTQNDTPVIQFTNVNGEAILADNNNDWDYFWKAIDDPDSEGVNSVRFIPAVASNYQYYATSYDNDGIYAVTENEGDLGLSGGGGSATIRVGYMVADFS